MKFSGKGLQISERAIIGRNVRIGDNTIIYDNVVLEDGVTVCNDCVIGEPLSDYYSNSSYQNPPTVIGKNSLIRSHSIIYAGSDFGEGFSTGHRVTIRENTVLGKNCRVGTLCDIQGDVVIGSYCWLHSNVHIGQKSKIGDFVFIYPYVVFTNDPHPPSDVICGPTVDDFTQIAVGVVLLPGVKVGKHCLLAANCVVSKDVEDYALVAGNPAKYVKDIREVVSRKSGVSHYPWPYNFERGMPWEGIGYAEWKDKKK